MRSLTATLLAAQKKAAVVPYVRVEAKNKIAGVTRYDFSRLYTGTEDDYFHALTMPGDGSLIRARITPPADSNKLYYQRVASPGPGSDFSTWTYANQFNALAVAAASLGAEVSIFWIKSDTSIRRIKSTDYGASWSAPELIDYAATANVNGLCAAYKPGGDLAIFFAEQSNLYVKKQVGGSWQAISAWDKTTGDLSGVACVYDNDWNLVLSGKDAAGNFMLWSLVYGDGGDVPAGNWSSLKEIASAPSAGEYEYKQPFLDKPDVYRIFFLEKFTGTEAHNRPFWSHSVPETEFISNLWREPVPFNLSSQYGLAIAHYGDYCWLSNPAGVWRANLTTQSLDLTQDVISLKEELGINQGKLTVELRNDSGKYATPGSGSLSVLNIGCQLDLSPGCVTSAGNEVSAGQSFSLESFEHTSAGGRASLVLHTLDAWAAIDGWKARNQFRWNKASSESNVKDILSFILGRMGLKLEVKSESSVITSFYPDFTINPGNSGSAVIQKLLSFVPDVLFIEGNKAYLLNPQSSDASSYSYGGEHQIFQGRYARAAWKLNRIQVEGYDSPGGQAIIKNCFTWSEIDRLYDRLEQVEDGNLGTVSAAQQRGDAYLREADIESGTGVIEAPVNCGQQLYDVIDITDARAGLAGAKRRLRGLTLIYNPSRAEYKIRLGLGAV